MNVWTDGALPQSQVPQHLKWRQHNVDNNHRTTPLRTNQQPVPLASTHLQYQREIDYQRILQRQGQHFQHYHNQTYAPNQRIQNQANQANYNQEDQTSYTQTPHQSGQEYHQQSNQQGLAHRSQKVVKFLQASFQTVTNILVDHLNPIHI